MTEQPDHDPVTLAVVRNAMKATAEEMGITLTRTAYSTNIKDRKDLSCAVYSASGQLIAQAEHIPLHLGMMPSAVRATFEEIDALEPGDSIMHNDPYLSGTHLPDVMVFTPVFHEGEQIAIAGNLAHHVDVGGSVPGSVSSEATEIFQEGIRFPPVKIRKRGTLDDELADILLNNVRTQDVSKGDLSAQIASTLKGEENLVELAEKYGTRGLQTHMNGILDYSERRMRERIDEINDGSGEFTDYIEGDGIISEDEDIPINVRVEVNGDEIHVDFSGSSDETEGPLNAVRPLTLSCVYYVVKAIVDPDLPTNDGAYRPISVETPEGTIVNATFPSPTGNANAITSQRIVDALIGAFREIVPEQTIAACSGTMNGVMIGGEKADDNDELYSYVETYGGGQGALAELDGMDGVHTHMTNTRNAPVEVLENTYPFNIRRYGLVPDSEGAGTHRGGMGMTREIELHNDATITVMTDRRRHRPWGVDGGLEANGTSITVEQDDGTEEELRTKEVRSVEAGETFSIETAGGGGWGSPLNRDPEKVARDVVDELVSQERARDVYGVVVEDGKLDRDATEQLREEMRTDD